MSYPRLAKATCTCTFRDWELLGKCQFILLFWGFGPLTTWNSVIHPMNNRIILNRLTVGIQGRSHLLSSGTLCHVLATCKTDAKHTQGPIKPNRMNPLRSFPDYFMSRDSKIQGLHQENQKHQLWITSKNTHEYYLLQHLYETSDTKKHQETMSSCWKTMLQLHHVRGRIEQNRI